MELSILTQLSGEIECILLSAHPLDLFLLNENLHSFFAQMNIISASLIYRINWVYIDVNYTDIPAFDYRWKYLQLSI